MSRKYKNNKMDTKIQTARSLSQKLQNFHETLPKDEQNALEKLLIYFNNKIKASDAGAELLKTRGGREIIDEMTKLDPIRPIRGLPGRGPLTPVTPRVVGPTITTVTITTTIASHKIITCSIPRDSIKGTVIRKKR